MSSTPLVQRSTFRITSKKFRYEISFQFPLYPQIVVFLFKSMQQSPTNLECNAYDYKQDLKRMSPQWTSLKRNKCGGSADYPCRSNAR